MSHVLVPPLRRPKADYVKISSLMTPPVKKPAQTMQDGLRDALEASWRNNESLGSLPKPDGRTVRKEKQQTKSQSQKNSSVAFVKRRNTEGGVSIVKIKPKRPRDESLNFIQSKKRRCSTIDLTLSDNGDDTVPIQKAKRVRAPQNTSDTTPLEIGIIEPVPFPVFLSNIRFIFSVKNVPRDMTSDFTTWGASLQRRALAVDQLVSLSSGDEFCLGERVWTALNDITKFTEEDTSDEDADGIVDVSGSVSQQQPPPQSLSSIPKIDLAARRREKKSITQRTPHAARPSKKATEKQFTPSMASHASSHLTPLPSSWESPTNEVLQNGEDILQSPIVPSAKALGKRKAVDPSLEPLTRSNLFPDVAIPEQRLSVHGGNLDMYINYLSSPSPTRLSTSHNPFSHLDGISSMYPEPIFGDFDPLAGSSSNEPHAATSGISQFFPEGDYGGLTNQLEYFGGDSLGGLQTDSGLLLPWPSPDRAESYNPFGTIDPTLLGGDPVVSLENQNDQGLDIPAVDGQLAQSPVISSSVSPASSSTSASNSPFGKSRSESVSVSNFRPRKTKTESRTQGRPPAGEKNLPSHRIRVKKQMDDMIPISEVEISSSESEFEIKLSSLAEAQKKRAPRTVGHLSDKVKVKEKVKEGRQSHAAAVVTARRLVNGKSEKVMVGGQLWPLGKDVDVYCHQCRNKTAVLKLACQRCLKRFCVRCLTVR